MFEIQKSWPRWVGNDLAAHTRPVSFRSGRLTVLVERPGDSFTLRYQIPQLLRFLKAATQDKAEEIIIRPGEPSNFTS
ncbi:MAG: DUF721 domain-containing protein [Candidatus Omnitrophica bacterium]|nr:DUF721 domain-containing protein [Candidatus Omnitrophota bacterium]